ncbi:alpha-amylase 3, chloroplastic isoform X1 [Rhododendron vialii]|uniref:alpha-amylase 3, chloroplastic isoform X1 n=1 Tax=Rhododendron vialii TaxID=182163 RepID=UPI00265F82CD|nr:alpha-amylase 3, chloroplastic isoform X1 [Rhododendron vialii]
MSAVAIEPLRYPCRRDHPKFTSSSKKTKAFSTNYAPLPLSVGASHCRFRPARALPIRATSVDTAAVVETLQSDDVFFKETFPLERIQKVEGKISVRLDGGKGQENWQLTVGCNIPGKWVLHWGVNYVKDVGRKLYAVIYFRACDIFLSFLSKCRSEWDQPPAEMRPVGSILIKDYAIETPLKKSATVVEGNVNYEVKIDICTNKDVAAINFVLKDVETGAWYQHRGRDFKVALIDYLREDGSIVGAKKGLGVWSGTFGQLSSIFLKSEGAHPEVEESIESGDPNLAKRLEGFFEEHSIVKEVHINNSVSVVVQKCPKTSKNLLHIETDLTGDIVIHWGVCKDDDKKWEIPAEPYPAETTVFKNKALRTVLKKKESVQGGWSSFTLDEGYKGFVFVLKINENTWLNCMGNDFYVPLPNSSGLPAQSISGQRREETNQAVSPDVYTDGIIKEIRNLVGNISSEKSRKTKTKEAQESILQEIEKLAAEAYSIFRTSIPTFSEEAVVESEALKPAAQISSGTGSGFEILCQGFNWESQKSGRWYMELKEKIAEISSLGFTVVWLPPPTDSVSPEGYMPRDLYNLNSRYGNTDELKLLVKRFHEVGIKVLGDVVLNHRCAQYRNQNGVWNIFGGLLNWDDRAVVADDPHFQGRGNKSSGDNFHAAPNIDHSQEFVRKDLKEWLLWLRKEIGYDGWRLDFVRGFWGGYVKDYLDATGPYFAVGEYWDSLSYTYGEMDHNQDAHRQRIIDWINATSGTAGAFDVTTKGILHAALERCEYWRLSDQKGKPPGVVGWWPSRAVTFIENHDTGSTQGHWRFPGGKEMQGYAYILTHPGTPAVFYDHIFSHLRSEISALISLRNRNKIHCRSTVQITKAERDVYAAVIGEKVAVKIGPGYYKPPSGPQSWSLAAEGKDYKVWEAS